MRSPKNKKEEKQEWKEWKSMLLNDSTYFLWKLFRDDYGSDMDFVRYQLGVPEKFLGDTRVYYYIKKWKEKDSEYIKVKTYQYPIKKLLNRIFGL